VKISYGESLPKKGCSRLNPFIAPWFVMKDVVSLGKVCGGPRLL
jgi:hypothetical protein